MYQSLNMRMTSNAITNNRTVNLDSGKTVTQPINTSGNYSINFWGGMGFKVKKIDSRFDIWPNFNYSRNADVFNSVVNYSTNFSGGLGFGFSKSKDKKYDLNINNNFSYNNSTNSQSSSSSHYYTNTVSLNLSVNILKTLVIKTDFDYYIQQKTQDLSSDLTTKLWNAKLQKTFKNDEFTLYLTVRDILNQNVGIYRGFDRNTFSETRNDRLQRYWLLGFAWNFKNSGAAAK